MVERPPFVPILTRLAMSAKVYPDPYQTSKMERFVKIVNSL